MKTPFPKFFLCNGIQHLHSNMALFLLTHTLRKSSSALIHYVKTFNIANIALFLVLIIGVIWYKSKRNPQRKEESDES